MPHTWIKEGELVMVKIRLARRGRKGRPHYRIVAVDSRRKRDGGFLGDLGYYDPFNKKLNVDIYLMNSFVEEGGQFSHGFKRLLSCYLRPSSHMEEGKEFYYKFKDYLCKGIKPS